LPSLRFLLFLSVATTIPAAACLYVGWRLIGPARLGPPWSGLAWALVVLGFLSMPVALGLGHLVKGSWTDVPQVVAFLMMGLLSFLFFLVLGRDLLWLLLRTVDLAVPLLPSDPENRRRILAFSGLAILVASFVLLLVGNAGARREPRLERVSIVLPDLPPAFEGFHIAEIADVHLGPTVKGPFLRRVVERTNDLHPDVVAIVGDLVDGSVDRLAADAAPVADLRAPSGVFFVTGNHETYSGLAEWNAWLGEHGVTVLSNEHRVLERDDARIVLAGVPDFMGERFGPAQDGDAASGSDPLAALAGAPLAPVRILLAHQPASARDAEKAGFDLMLCGHTHGGQFWPWTLLVRRVQLFERGLGRLGHIQVYTSRGTGTWGPPLRLGSPSEITLITLVRGGPDDGP
jgi:uncharacterized protein